MILVLCNELYNKCIQNKSVLHSQRTSLALVFHLWLHVSSCIITQILLLTYLSFRWNTTDNTAFFFGSV